MPLSKRLLDVLLSGLGLLLSLPLWGMIALAVKLEDGAPVFYGQLRVGKGGEPFRSWKFRSMRDAEDANGGGRPGSMASSKPPRSDGRGPAAERQASPDDPRVTRLGRVLRATAMDELPQLWSIFRGDMSLVGPRPLLPREAEVGSGGEVRRLEDVPGYRERHSVVPGLTGLAQVRAPRDLPARQKFRYDLLYVRNRTLALDVQLILESLWISLRGAWPDVGRDGKDVGR